MLKKILFLVLLTGALYAQQKAASVPGEVIIRFNDGIKGGGKIISGGNILVPKKALSRRLGIWLYETDGNTSETIAGIRQSATDKGIKAIQANHRISLRSGENSTILPDEVIPNDTGFVRQWGLHNTGQTGGTPDADIDAPEAWEYEYDALTAGGEQIVIAVIDNGFDLEHRDINYFTNVNEIPGNGIDDDNNGYVDDYRGWNAYNSTDSIDVQWHGTHVSGIAGAKGNNITGISGVMPGAEILPVAGASAFETDIIEAYLYIYNMRLLYNESGGQKGAFIVAANSSFGVDRADPTDYPVWCSLFDDLGNIGILSTVAPANVNIDIDYRGDMPGACKSDFIIAVAATDFNDAKESRSSYGAVSVDLAAPGKDIYSTTTGNRYIDATGTSMAAPFIAGAIGLLYSAMNENLLATCENDPASVALYVKDVILSTVDEIEGLENKTLTGGRLNLLNAIEKITGQTQETPPAIAGIMPSSISSNAISLTWQVPSDTNKPEIKFYDIRISENPVDNISEFNSAKQIPFAGFPSEPGENESVTIDNLLPGTLYYIGVRTGSGSAVFADSWPVVQASTLRAPELAINPEELRLEFFPGKKVSDTLTISNVSEWESTLDFEAELVKNNFPAGKVKLTSIDMQENRTPVKKGMNKISGGFALTGSGGPDNYGYRWKDSRETDGPEFVWEDISDKGTELTDWTATGSFEAKDDGFAGPVEMEMDFIYYGEKYSSVYVGSNGFITFGRAGAGEYNYSVLPSPGSPNNVVAPFWGDLSGSSHGKVFCKPGNGKFIIQYENWGSYSGSDSYTFQVVLFENGKINFYYLDMAGNTDEAVTGFENINGTDGLTLAFNTPYVEDSLAATIEPEPEWVIAGNLKGRLLNGTEAKVIFEFDAESLLPGNYHAELLIKSNDPDNPVKTVPVDMELKSDNIPWSADIFVKNAGDTAKGTRLTYGLHYSATAGIDEYLGEDELPPLPPAGVFDARFRAGGYQGLALDYRGFDTDSVKWIIDIQPGDDGFPVGLKWDIAKLPAGTMRLTDISGAKLNIDMNTDSLCTITDNTIKTVALNYYSKGVFGLALRSGWNLVSLPAKPVDGGYDKLLDLSSADIFTYDNKYTLADSLSAGKGFWIKTTRTDTFTYEGNTASGYISILKGWNIIGPLNTSWDTENITTEPDGIIASPYYGFSSGYKTAEYLERGKGYWLLANEAGKLRYEPPAGKTTAGQPISDNNGIVIEDAAGNTVTLYSGRTPGYPLPPLPPAGVFDARYLTDNLVESLSARQGIRIRSAVYPVTVTPQDAAVNIIFPADGNTGRIISRGESFKITDENVKLFYLLEAEIPSEFALAQNYPNPFNPSTRINFSLPENADVSITIFNVLGQQIPGGVNKFYPAGNHSWEFNASHLPSGVYIYSLRAEGSGGRVYSGVRKMVVVK